MKDGKPVTIRPIRPEDEPAMIEFHKKLSERSVYLRYFQPLKLTHRTAHEWSLTRTSASSITTARSRWWPESGSSMAGGKRCWRSGV